MDTRIYVMTHKEYTKPDDDLYISLGVGKKLNPTLPYPGDDTGDNISDKNKSYCELTGIYWLWKNVICDIVGICHYRRYFVNDEHFLTQQEIENILEDYDVIVSRSTTTKYVNLGEHYRTEHVAKDLDVCRQVVEELCPEYLSSFDLCMDCNLFTLGNMMIASKCIFDSYCSWLFPILAEVEHRVDITGYDTYQGRIFGYLSERLLRVWLLQQPLRVKEVEARMIDPKDSNNAVKSIGLIYRYAECVVKDLITLYSTGNYFDMEPITPIKDMHGKIPVWVCWWQGEAEEPELIRMCIDSIRRNIPEDIAKLHVITLSNVQEYVTFPSWIIQKFNEGQISLTHMSDILRMGLLYRYGGMWLDATYYVSEKISYELLTDTAFYTIRHHNSRWLAEIAQGRWASNLLIGKPGNVLFRFVLNALYLYWYQQDKLIDYYLVDYMIALAYNHIDEVKSMIDQCPYTNPDVYELGDCLNKRYDAARYEKLNETTQFFKLTRRQQFQKETIVGEETYYGHILST